MRLDEVLAARLDAKKRTVHFIVDNRIQRLITDNVVWKQTFDDLFCRFSAACSCSYTVTTDKRFQTQAVKLVGGSAGSTQSAGSTKSAGFRADELAKFLQAHHAALAANPYMNVIFLTRDAGLARRVFWAGRVEDADAWILEQFGGEVHARDR